MDSKNLDLHHKGRLLYIDFLRGLSMIFVIFGHFSPNFTSFFMVTSGFKMPAFFAISGFLFSWKGSLQWQKLLFRIGMPMLFLSFIPNCGLELVKGNWRTAAYVVYDGLTGWFLATFFYATILFRIIFVFLMMKR